MSCGHVQSINVTLQLPRVSPMFQEHRNWEWNTDGDIILRLVNISYCDPPATVSVQGSEAVVMGYRKFNAVHAICTISTGCYTVGVLHDSDAPCSLGHLPCNSI